MITLIAVAALASAPATVSSPSASAATETPWELFTALSGGVQSATGFGTATGRIGFTRRISSIVVPELHLLAGFAPDTTQISTGLRLGSRFELPRDGIRPFVYVAFAHSHECPAERMLHAPVAMLLGLSEDGVTHRSGADGGLGFVYDFPKVRPGTLAARLGLRAGAVGMLGSGAKVTFETLGTFGVLF